MRSLNDITREFENSIDDIGECRRDWALVCRFVDGGPGEARKSTLDPRELISKPGSSREADRHLLWQCATLITLQIQVVKKLLRVWLAECERRGRSYVYLQQAKIVTKTQLLQLS